MKRFLLAAICLATPSTLIAQDLHHGDIEITSEGGSVVVEPGAEGWVFEGEFIAPPDAMAYFGDEPGFDSEPGSFTAGDQVGFEVLSDLLFWNGSAMTDPADRVEISKGPASILLAAGTGPQEGFGFGTADSTGVVHDHLEFALQTLSGSDYVAGGAAGVYGLHLLLNSPQYGDSQLFLIALNNGLDEEAFEEGAEILAAAAGVPVPEPGALFLAAAASCAFVFIRRRMS